MLAPTKILVLEGDRALREATRMLLKSEGYCVLTATSLSAAVEVARQAPGIEVLLVEDHLPDCAIGVQAIVSLREITGSNLKALLITPRICANLRAFGRDGHVRLAAGPVSADGLIEQLQALCRS